MFTASKRCDVIETCSRTVINTEAHKNRVKFVISCRLLSRDSNAYVHFKYTLKIVHYFNVRGKE
jgi:hypothetical protein